MTYLRVNTGLIIAALLLTLVGCGETRPQHRAVYLLMDTSGTYTEELAKAQGIMNYLLATLDSGDAVAVARIDSGSFSEKDIVAKATFDERPSVANQQKRAFKQQLDVYVKSVRHGSRHTDITGGLLQASEFLNETGAGEKYVLVFSDLEEDLEKGHIRDFPIALEGIRVVALNVTKLRTDNIDPRDYLRRLEAWQKRVVEGGGQWAVMNDLERLDQLIAAR
ncbi:vWA domain-containing protein [Simiduia agarivorans]|uniref:Response regulator receiver domain-containing protein n=1 Tax=Simiduia agarivorans (strain DSM 21679 / JCM 13881 / BCRC 17597 / SA1) TaxID=1117647 RepID=K4KP22_SIMAS|nr:vWA domain-containing protein [Simiduia agarivorans]AFV00762.1 response regulator receiver domain-containing protein [Simiduia agarivorans SA1 = DSM 21679]